MRKVNEGLNQLTRQRKVDAPNSPTTNKTYVPKGQNIKCIIIKVILTTGKVKMMHLLLTRHRFKLRTRLGLVNDLRTYATTRALPGSYRRS